MTEHAAFWFAYCPTSVNESAAFARLLMLYLLQNDGVIYMGSKLDEIFPRVVIFTGLLFSPDNYSFDFLQSRQIEFFNHFLSLEHNYFRF